MENPPAKRALAALEAPAPIVPPDAPKKISKKIRAAIDLMVSGECKTLTDAAAKVGLARESIGRALNKPHVAAHLRQRVLKHLGIAAARAGATKVELLDSDSEIARDRASTFVLGLAGIAPAAEPSVNVNVEVRAGFVIDLSPEPGERSTQPAAAMRIVSPIAAPAIEHDADAE
jgi:hypothetical protein